MAGSPWGRVGRSGIEARIREHCRLAAVLVDLIEGEVGFALAAPPSMGVVRFRCLHDGDEAGDRLNEPIVNAVNG